tara:strand:- start:160260 stop:162812 length:2553 start_codon:yes stop_codon:yes gene_type:complete
MEAQQRVHELITQKAPLDEVLAALTDWVGMSMPGAIVSVMRFDPQRQTLSLVPGKQFSPAYIAHMQGIPVDVNTGTCGPAAVEKRLVITEDIREDSNWSGYCALAVEEGLQACWSTPILTAGDELLGTFATYYKQPAAPREEDLINLERGAALASLAFVRERDSSDHQALAEWHRTLFDNHPDGVFTFDLDGRFQSCNAALTRISGFLESQIVGLHFNQFVVPECQEVTQAGFDRARSGEVASYETVGKHVEGHTYPLTVTNFPVVIGDEIVGVYGICRDISNRKSREAQLYLLQRGVEASQHGILMVDARQQDMPVVYVNPAFTAMTGYTRQDILGRNCRILQGEGTDPQARDEIRAGVRDAREVDTVILNYRKDGTPFWNHLRINPVLDERGACTHFIGIQQDITRHREQEAQIAYQATHDLLTGLPNQVSFIEHLVEVFEGPQASSGLLVVMNLDMDGFKPINEGLGHQVGNQVLAEVAKRLGGVVSPDTVVSRLVGDEFGLLIKDCAGREAAKQLADTILERLSQPYEIDHHLIHLSASIGIACNCEPLSSPHELMQHADLAVEQAKRQGRNTWQWYRGHMAERTRQHVVLRHELLRALQEDQFELHYQPVVEAVSGRIKGLEALIRWQHPKLGLVSPGDFIPLAEQTGQIIPLTRWVLRQACREIGALNDSSNRTLPVAVNISSLQFRRDGFLEDVQAILKETGFPPSLLELEVTESVLMDGVEPVVELMQALRSMGISLALDDFGTGFSSLGYMRDLPTSKVKLDRSFVAKTTSDRRTAAIVQGVITMAHHMEMNVVAEGIETAEEWEDLVHRNCDLLQGFWFARPMPLAALRDLPDKLPVGVK